MAEGPTHYLNETGKRLFGVIAERSRSIAVRGDHSAEALAAIGIKDRRVIGCPTLFRHRQPTLEVRRVEADAIHRLGFTLRRRTYTAEPMN